MKQWECIDKSGKVVARLHALDLAKANALAKAMFSKLAVAEVREADVVKETKPVQAGPARDADWKSGTDNNAPKVKKPV